MIYEAKVTKDNRVVGVNENRECVGWCGDGWGEPWDTRSTLEYDDKEYATDVLKALIVLGWATIESLAVETEIAQLRKELRELREELKK